MTAVRSAGRLATPASLLLAAWACVPAWRRWPEAPSRALRPRVQTIRRRCMASSLRATREPNGSRPAVKQGACLRCVAVLRPPAAAGMGVMARILDDCPEYDRRGAKHFLATRLHHELA